MFICKTERKNYMNRIKRVTLMLTVIALCAAMLAGFTGEAQEDAQEFEYEKAVITMEDGGVIELALLKEFAPATVENFVKLVDEGFYDGLIFHRVIKDFMIQGGDPLGTGMGGSEETIYGEFAENGWDNPITHQPGVISMARSNDPDSASSQFFITHGDASFLDGKYAAFGFVINGMDVVDAIANVGTDSNDRPLEDVVIESIKMDGAGTLTLE